MSLKWLAVALVATAGCPNVVFSGVRATLAGSFIRERQNPRRPLRDHIVRTGTEHFARLIDGIGGAVNVDGLDRSIRAVLKYVWPVLSSAKRSGRVYYRAVCPPNYRYYPLRLPKIDVQQPSITGTALTDVRSIFRQNRNVKVAEDKTGIIRIGIGKVPDSVLQTRLSKLSFDAEGQYNTSSAIGAIESAPEVRSVMRTLNVRIPARVYHYALVEPAARLPHLPAEISNVTWTKRLT